jgi:hypothetical protein
MSEGTNEQDYQMLSLVVNDAMDGIDISQRYPAFYRKMLANPALFESFLDILESLEEAPSDVSLSSEEARDRLSFLGKSTPQPIIGQPELGHWTVLWKQSARRLQHLFVDLGTPTVTYRGDDLDDLLEESYVTLLQDSVEVGGKAIDILLEAVRDYEIEALQCLLSLTVQGNREAIEATLPAISVHVEWGRYDQTITLDLSGRAKLPPIPFDLITDPATQTIVSGLRVGLDLKQ